MRYFQLAIVLLVSLPVLAEQINLKSHFFFKDKIPLTIVILDKDSWTAKEVTQRIRRAEEIYSNCQIQFAPIEIHFIEPPIYRSINYNKEEDILAIQQLGFTNKKPVVFFTGVNSAVNKYDAYSWNKNSDTDPIREGSAFIFEHWKYTERVHVKLFAGITDYEVLAHELGHILLNQTEHLNIPNNVMSVKRAPMGAEFTKDQCIAIHGSEYLTKK